MLDQPFGGLRSISVASEITILSDWRTQRLAGVISIRRSACDGCGSVSGFHSHNSKNNHPTECSHVALVCPPLHFWFVLKALNCLQPATSRIKTQQSLQSAAQKKTLVWNQAILRKPQRSRWGITTYMWRWASDFASYPSCSRPSMHLNRIQ